MPARSSIPSWHLLPLRALEQVAWTLEGASTEAVPSDQRVSRAVQHIVVHLRGSFADSGQRPHLAWAALELLRALEDELQTAELES